MYIKMCKVLLICIICCLTQNSLSQEDGLKVGYTFHNANINLKMTNFSKNQDDTVAYDSYQFELSFHIDNLQTNQSKTIIITLKNNPLSVDDLTLSSNGLLLVKYHNKYFCYLQVYDIAKEIIIDTLIISNISFSPSHKFLVYVTSYEKMALPNFKKTTLMLYEFDRAYEWKPIHNNAGGPIQATGWPLYPEEFAITQDFLISPKNLIFSPILWSEDETKLYFCAFEESDQKNYFIQIDLSQDIDYPIIIKKQLDYDTIFSMEDLINSKKKELEINPYIFSPSKVEWKEKNIIRIIPRDTDRWLKKDILIIVPLTEEK